jgi:uncharacterized protein (DUF58 family)
MLFIGILKGINLVIILGYLLIGLWLINWFLARRALRGISARRLHSQQIQAGTPTEWFLDIRDDGRGVGSWSLEERIGEGSAQWLVVQSGSGVGFRPRVRATFPRRGKFVIEPLIARSSFPFGLVRKSVRLTPPDEIIVLPKPARVDGERLRTWLSRKLVGRDEERRKLRRLVDREAEVHGLRDYRPGDSPRRVHWKATARRGRLIVREYEDSSPPRLLLVVEPWKPERASHEDLARLESLISLAAGVCKEWRRQAGGRLALVVAGPSPMGVDGAAGPSVTERQLIALAIEPGGEPGEVQTVLGGLSRITRSAPVLLLSSRADSPLMGVLTRNLGNRVAFANVERADGWFQLP